MKRSGVLHGELSRLIAEAGHGDLIAIADCGLPVPPHVPLVDLAVTPGVPSFDDVLEAVLAELVVEDFIAAEEWVKRDPAHMQQLRERVGTRGTLVSHDRLKNALQRARAVIRTGEFTPYANVILVAGVAF
ncbi:D-ribose pyranase [Alicyclobacillus sacchari]|uniref:D-ribose pyranase n=1 Tax=Alicyclobacillus sacchari TaxID=392010 RepID=A0A4R8LIB3_9BACL|nr:D-ribose pyranase [Alicyclobacillus sacchari]TDY42148.1 D-ribose pyranase [Alicyclobacillus sacchari]GMA59268.1 D-ribose pyranase [Alicyclobacillus sacchari]GMA59411.1 D-ribose pyranase [Alicyclobacillus sacchari]